MVTLIRGSANLRIRTVVHASLKLSSTLVLHRSHPGPASPSAIPITWPG